MIETLHTIRQHICARLVSKIRLRKNVPTERVKISVGTRAQGTIRRVVAGRMSGSEDSGEAVHPTLPPCLQHEKSILIRDGFQLITPNLQKSNFVNCIDASTQYFLNETTKRLVSFTYFGDHVEGPPNMVHGGALFTVVDFSLALCVNRIMKCLAFTANISINYRAPTKLRDWVVVEVDIDRVEKQKKVFVKFQAQSLSFDEAPVSEDGDQNVPKELSSKSRPELALAPAVRKSTLVEGTSLFIASLSQVSSI